ncbi:MAG: TIGR01458 family HAD-type hydrolase [Candidatus Dadabacteria bacterium]|nr:TIGR01458 family HAD-type hydrolase [Candidatus Dadabacteria bacterium]
MIEGIFLDISGVLLDGAELLPNADQAINYIEAKNLPYRLITNTSQQPRFNIVKQLQQAGINVVEEHIYTAPLAAKDYVLSHNLRPFCLIHRGLKSEFSEVEQSDPNAVIIGDAADDFNYAYLNCAFRLCIEGAPLIAIGHNKYYKKSGEYFLDAGPFVEAIEYACDIEAVITGKPSVDFFNQVLASIQLKPEQVALIGDDIYSDIQGAINAGLESRLVRTGKYRDGDENKTTPKAIVEDNVLSAIEDLL